MKGLVKRDNVITCRVAYANAQQENPPRLSVSQCYCLMCNIHLKSINHMDQISISLSSLCALCCICPY